MNGSALSDLNEWPAASQKETTAHHHQKFNVKIKIAHEGPNEQFKRRKFTNVEKYQQIKQKKTFLQRFGERCVWRAEQGNRCYTTQNGKIGKELLFGRHFDSKCYARNQKSKFQRWAVGIKWNVRPCSEPQGLIYSDWKKKQFSQFCISFSSDCSSRTKLATDLEFIRGERKFYLDYRVVRFCTSIPGKQAVDRIVWKTCSKTLHLHNFYRIIQKFFMTH